MTRLDATPGSRYVHVVTAKKQPSSGKALSFEEAMAQLESIIEKIEGGGVGLEESLKEYERGMQLLGLCQGVLATAEQRLEELKGQRGAPSTPAPTARDESEDEEGDDDSPPKTSRDDLPF